MKHWALAFHILRKYPNQEDIKRNLMQQLHFRKATPIAMYLKYMAISKYVRFTWNIEGLKH